MSGVELPIFQPGTGHQQRLIVSTELTVPRLSPEFTGFAKMLMVFATAYMIGFVECTCAEFISAALPAGWHSVGTSIAMSHEAATLVGMTVTAKVLLTASEKRRLCFAVECHDDVGIIGRGTHERVIVELASFMARAGERVSTQ